MEKLRISVCTYEGGEFDVFIIDRKTGEEVCLTGKQDISDDDHEVLTRLAPACVHTDYEQVDTSNYGMTEKMLCEKRLVTALAQLKQEQDADDITLKEFIENWKESN